MRFLLITPPLTQLNTPYPATAQLKGFLQAEGHHVEQADLSIELVDNILKEDFLKSIGLSEQARCIEQVKRFLHGEDDTLAQRIANRSLLPEGKRFAQMADLEWSFGTAGTIDKARYLATLFIEEIADHIREKIDPHFDLIRYAEFLSNDAPTFDPIEKALGEVPSEIERLYLQLLDQHIEQCKPDIVGFAIPFPGCLFATLRCAQHIKQHGGETVVLGGGFPTTEWRSLNEPRIWKYADFIVLDDGEMALLEVAKLVSQGTPHCHTPICMPYSEAGVRASDFTGLPLEKYLSLMETANPMHRLWSCGRWNKMMVAHGCYWHRCAFCDTTLPYIGKYHSPTASNVVDRMEQAIEQTRITGFHFVDEALPPKLLEDICQEILRRRLVVSFWGNIRFEKAYTPQLCDLLSEAGCIAVSGGLEVASDRLLKLMDKGVTIQQAVDCCRNLRNAGIMVHTYLMYGFPTETLKETFDALEVVRQMFDEGIIQSAFWHRFAMTCHSPAGQHPEHFSTKATSHPHPFCNNEIDWEQKFDYDLDVVGRGLSFATYNYMHDIGLDEPLRRWFPDLKTRETRSRTKKRP